LEWLTAAGEQTLQLRLMAHGRRFNTRHDGFLKRGTVRIVRRVPTRCFDQRPAARKPMHMRRIGGSGEPLHPHSFGHRWHQRPPRIACVVHADGHRDTRLGPRPSAPPLAPRRSGNLGQMLDRQDRGGHRLQGREHRHPWPPSGGCDTQPWAPPHAAEKGRAHTVGGIKAPDGALASPSGL
jgi:hypothetical protein